MQHAHYPLQALLYVVALHRFLRWRVAGYDPDEHLAGVLYLFLRGMVGPATPRRRRRAVRRLLVAAVRRARRRPRATCSTRGGRGVSPTLGRDVRPARRRVARRATGLLRAFNVAGVLTRGRRPRRHAPRPARRRGRRRRPARRRLRRARPRGCPTCASTWRPCATTATTELDEAVDLDALPWPDPDEWPARTAASPLVSCGDASTRRPLCLEGTRLYLDRYWRQELAIAGGLVDRAARPAAAGRRRRPRRRPRPPVRAGRRRPAARRRGGRRAVRLRGRRRRPRHRQDDDGRPHRRPARRAGRRGRRPSTARRPRRADGQGRRPARGSRARRGPDAWPPRRTSGPGSSPPRP